ncbi:unnamed protein product [Mytilus coruscus]|uniref:Uncharacterized protein n=1 Tax=Mytilus coruscus TaxID=42192 RepID=A0A6J8DBY4_MYTCO|nr:unnamed protein product [Mytilus coruscus]
MEDTITPDISIALYRYLCQNITGSEDYVKRIRFMNAVKDTMSTTQKIPTITSGSFGEGLEMRGSDLDIMCVRKDVEVYENVKPRFNPNISYLSMERDDVKPGFTQLRIDDRRSQNVLQSCKEHNVKLKFETRSGIGTLEKPYGTLASSTADKFEVLNQFSTSVFTHTDDLKDYDTNSESNNVLDNFNICQEDVLKKLNK